MLNIDELKFDEKGLIPAIVVDANTKKEYNVVVWDVIVYTASPAHLYS